MFTPYSCVHNTLLVLGMLVVHALCSRYYSETWCSLFSFLVCLAEVVTVRLRLVVSGSVVYGALEHIPLSLSSPPALRSSLRAVIKSTKRASLGPAVCHNCPQSRQDGRWSAPFLPRSPWNFHPVSTSFGCSDAMASTTTPPSELTMAS